MIWYAIIHYNRDWGISRARILMFFCAAFARMHRPRKSQQYRLAIPQWKITAYANLGKFTKICEADESAQKLRRKISKSWLAKFPRPAGAGGPGRPGAGRSGACGVGAGGLCLTSGTVVVWQVTSRGASVWVLVQSTLTSRSPPNSARGAGAAARAGAGPGSGGATCLTLLA